MRIADPTTPTQDASTDLKPAVPIKKSVTPDAIICLEDGKAFKSLKRISRTKYGMTPEEYRAKWGFPGSYPMVAPSYAEKRSALARTMGLGNQRRKVKEAKAVVAEVVVEKKVKKPRKKAA